jgi:hypothetical protein
MESGFGLNSCGSIQDVPVDLCEDDNEPSNSLKDWKLTK